MLHIILPQLASPVHLIHVEISIMRVFAKKEDTISSFDFLEIDCIWRHNLIHVVLACRHLVMQGVRMQRGFFSRDERLPWRWMDHCLTWVNKSLFFLLSVSHIHPPFKCPMASGITYTGSHEDVWVQKIVTHISCLNQWIQMRLLSSPIIRSQHYLCFVQYRIAST